MKIFQSLCGLWGLVLCLFFCACFPKTMIRSDPSGAEVYIGTSSKPAGVTPFETANVSSPICVKKDGETVCFKLKGHTDWGAACLNTSLACVASGLILGAVAGTVWLIGAVLAAAAPVIGPILAVCGSPPAWIGSAFWTIIGGTICGACALPFAAVSAGVGPEEVRVDLSRGTVTSVPAGEFVEVDDPRAAKAGDKTTSKTPSSAPGEGAEAGGEESGGEGPENAESGPDGGTVVVPF